MKAKQTKEILENTQQTVKDFADKAADVSRKAIDEYVKLGTRVQDELFEASFKGIETYRELCEMGMTNGIELFRLYEANCKTAQNLWKDAVRSWQDAVKDVIPA